MKHFTKLFTLLLMAAMSMGMMASTEEDLVVIDHNYVFIADNFNENGTVALSANTLYDEGRILSASWGGNNYASNKGSNTFASGGTHLNSVRVKNTQDMMAFKVSAPCTVTFYTYSDASRGIRVHKVKRVNDADNTYYMQQPASTPVWEVELDAAGVYYLSSYNGDFYFAGFEVLFADDPARLYTFGQTATVDDDLHTLSALTTYASGCSHVATSDVYATYNTFANRGVFHGNTTEYTVALDYRNLVNNTTLIKTQNGEEDGAETFGAYVAFDLTVDDGYFLNLREIVSDLYPENKTNWYYEFVIEDGEGAELYKSPIQHIAGAQSGTDQSVNIIGPSFDENLQRLTGTLTVKFIYWINSGGTALAIKDFKVTGVLHEIESQTKTLKAIEVNGVDYDYENDGNTISTLLHAVPEVKFYYDVTNNWSDGSQTIGDDEDETIVASLSGDDYVATTTKLATPYSLTFTNIDLPKTFGMGREFADATHFESGVEKLMGTAPDHVIVAIANGAGLTYQNTDCAVKHGTDDVVTAPTGYRNYCNVHSVAANAEFENDLYWGFSVDVALGYSMSISQIYGDMYAEKNNIQYKMGVYTSNAADAEPIYMSDVKSGHISTMGAANVPMTVNTSEVAALQNLKGKIYFRFYWNIASTAANAALKDFNISAAVDPVEGEGVKGLVFTDFTPAAHPEFTEGEVTAVFSNSSNNVGPDGSGRGIRMQGLYGYKMRLTVPGDSYISEVVFVWNNNGNPNEAGNCVNLTVKDNSETILGIVTDKKVSNEVTWTCGSVRESELTFAQGDGDFYLNSIRVTYLKKPATTTYVRSHLHRNLNTLCFPYQIDTYSGATFYTMLHKVTDGVTVTDIYLQEHVGALEAGTPYFYVPEEGSAELVCYYSGDREETPRKVNGVQGAYADNTAVPDGAFVTYNNNLQAVAGGYVTLGEYRAYVDMNEVPEKGVVAYLPGRKMLKIRNADAPAVATDVEEVQGNNVPCTKVIENGVLYLKYKGTKYNVQGMRVK